MKTVIKEKKFTWIDIQKPTQKDINFLERKFNFHPLVLDELLNPSYRASVEHHKDYIFMVLHFPIYSREERRTTSRELNIIATKNTLITCHHETISPIKILFKDCRSYAEKRNTYMSEGIGQLLYYVLSSAWKNCLIKLEKINKKTLEIEKEIFSGKEREMVLEISLVKTDIINFRRIINPQNEILDSLLEEGLNFFGNELSPYFSDLLGIYDKISNDLESQKEVILALEDVNQSMLSTRTNEIMRILTVFSVILLPLTLISSIWGMNFPASLPFMHSPIGFWAIFLIMAIIMGGMIAYFRKKKWL